MDLKLCFVCLEGMGVVVVIVTLSAEVTIVRAGGVSLLFLIFSIFP